MEASPLPTSSDDDWHALFDESLSRQRERIRAFLGAQKQRLAEAEATLAAQLNQLADQLGRERSETRHTRQEIDDRARQLDLKADDLHAVKQELAARQAEWEQLTAETRRQQEGFVGQIDRRQEELARQREELQRLRSDLEAAEAGLHHDRHALELAQQEHAAQRERLEELTEALRQQQAELDARQAKTDTARRRIAAELKTRRAEQLGEFSRLRAQIDQHATAELADLEQQIEAARTRGDKLAAELRLTGQREQELAARLEAVRTEQEARNNELAAAQKRSTELTAELDALRAEHAELKQQLAKSEQRLIDAEQRQAAAPAADADEADDQYLRRYEMALDDLKELKQENAELKQRLAQSAAARPASAPDGSLSWEAEKQRILAALESEFDDDEQGAPERLKIEQVVEDTERVVAEKDRELAELRRLLEERERAAEPLAAEAAAVGEMLDADEIVRQEREKLKTLQEEWHKKLIRAEIDISLERAKVARRGAELDGKIQALHSADESQSPADGQNESSSPPARGRWLARLGLKDPDT